MNPYGVLGFSVLMLLVVGIITWRRARMIHSLRLLSDDLKEKERSERASIEELQAANRRLEEASRAKSDFLANMSHELRAPLNTVIGFSEVLLDDFHGPVNEKQRVYVTRILASGRHLLRLIDDILDLAGAESGEMKLEVTRLPVKNLLDGSVILLREKAAKQGVFLGVEIAPEACIDIEGDVRKLRQIVYNLLDNAVKFNREGGSVTVRARLADPDGKTRGSDRGDRIEIAVDDTGIGIAPEQIPLLFDPFTQLESPYGKNHEGTGLGLALVKRMVELHGGTIRAESEPGKGSRFTFTIPVRQTPAAPEGVTHDRV